MFIKVFFYFVRGACAIAWPKRGEVIITGGKHTMSRATVYDESGWTGTELEDLNVGRQFHGCSAYELDQKTVGRLPVPMIHLSFSSSIFLSPEDLMEVSILTRQKCSLEPNRR